jgi:predicted permease
MAWHQWFSRARRDRERDEELREHLAHHTDDLIARGVAPDEARRQARLLLGNPRARREEIDDMQRVPFLDTFTRDLRYAVRVLRRTPSFTLTAIATLALVIGANTAVFSLANALLLEPLPYPDSDRLVLAAPEYTSPRFGRTGTSVDGFYAKAFASTRWGRDSAVTRIGTSDVNLVMQGQALLASEQRVSAGFFRVLGVPPAFGREFSPEEDVPGGPAVVILSHRMWRRVLDGDASGTGSILGQSIFLRGEPYQVVGIMPEGFRGTTDADVWTPLRPNTTGEGGGNNYLLLIRLPPAVPVTQAAAEMTPVVGAALSAAGLASDVQVTTSLISLEEFITGDLRDPIVMLGGAVGTVLIIACVNLAALLLARGGARAREIATRMALGSGRRAVVRQLMTESLVLAVAGGLGGVLVGWLGLEALQSLGGERFEDWRRATIDAQVLAACAGLSLLTSLIFGLVPAWQAGRIDLQHALVGGGTGGNRSVAAGGRHWTRRGLIVAQVALGVVLLVSAGLLIRTFVNLQGLSPGFTVDRLTTAPVSLLDARYPTPVEVNALFNRTLESIRATPGVEFAAVSLGLPYERVLNMGFRFPGDEKGATASVMYVTPDFFRTFEIPLRQGREVRPSDEAGTRQVVVVNEAFARVYSKDKAVLGRVIQFSNAEREIVGVAGDVQMRPGFIVGDMVPGPIVASPTIYLPAAQLTRGIVSTHIWFAPVWSVRASSPAVAARAIQDALNRADPLLPVGQIRQMRDVRAAATAEHTLLMTLVGALAAVALLLAAIGLHGLIAHSVTERTREFGIRLALGATPRGTVRAVALPGITVSAIGAALGLLLALPASRLVSSVLYGVAERDPITYFGSALFLFAVATVASILPALRILRLDPAKTLRQ